MKRNSEKTDRKTSNNDRKKATKMMRKRRETKCGKERNRNVIATYLCLYAPDRLSHTQPVRIMNACVFIFCLFIRLLFTFFPPVFNVILAWVLLGSFFHCIKHLRCVCFVYFDLFCVFSQHVSFACTFSLSLTEAAFTQREHNERNIHMEIS